jgi:hypothetical protein
MDPPAVPRLNPAGAISRQEDRNWPRDSGEMQKKKLTAELGAHDFRGLFSASDGRATYVGSDLLSGLGG